MEKKINVLVNGIMSRAGSVTAHNVRRMNDMNLMPVSVTTCGSYRKTSIDQAKIELINPNEINANCVKETNLLNYGRPDVVVDFAPDSFFRQSIPSYLDLKTSFILQSHGENKEDVKRLAENITKLGVNIALLPENCSEQDVLRVIRYLYQENEAGVFGKVFLLADIAA